MEMEGHLWKSERKAWGYGGVAQSLEDWKTRYKQSMQHVAQLRQQGLAAAVYTQLTDVETEINGLLTYDRVPKVDVAWLRAINEAVIAGKELPE